MFDLIKLDKEQYSWGNAHAHWNVSKEIKTSKVSKIAHKALAAIEFLPIFGQAISCIESKLAKHHINRLEEQEKYINDYYSNIRDPKTFLDRFQIFHTGEEIEALLKAPAAREAFKNNPIVLFAWFELAVWQDDSTAVRAYLESDISDLFLEKNLKMPYLHTDSNLIRKEISNFYTNKSWDTTEFEEDFKKQCEQPLTGEELSSLLQNPFAKSVFKKNPEYLIGLLYHAVITNHEIADVKVILNSEFAWLLEERDVFFSYMNTLNKEIQQALINFGTTRKWNTTSWTPENYEKLYGEKSSS